MDNFEQTVNLRKKNTGQRQTDSSTINKQTSRMREEKNLPFNQIEQPRRIKLNENIMKNIIWLAVIFVVGIVAYWLFFNNAGSNEKLSQNWHAVKLVSGDVFYGQIENTESDPIVLDNVYYNYGQESGDKNANEEGGNLRLVKRGQETHGPVGEMSIVRSQVLYMEPLKFDSKVLQAILNYEK